MVSYDFPYPSQRMPVFAENVVATSQPLASQAGLRMLLKGGNAVDAAIAAAAALTVVEPTSNGLGSDAFAILWDGEKLFSLNASGKSPAAWSPEMFSKYDTMPLTGWDTVTVPGAISAWVALHERYGKLTFAELLQPAIDYARNGFLASPITAAAWKSAEQRYRDFPEFQQTFLANGRAPHPGEKVLFPDHANTLEQIAATKGATFYTGEIAQKIVEHSNTTGGYFTPSDLADHAAFEVESASIEYRGYRLHEIPPNGQGLAALIALGILRHFDIASMPVDGVDFCHVQIEAMKIAFADVNRYLADPNFMEFTYERLIDNAYLESRANEIDMNRASDPGPGMPVTGGTVYLTTADANGMMVSFIQSNYYGFGSGIVVPGTGIGLQNRGSGFVLDESHPNRVDGSKRPFHTIIPGFLTKDGKPVMSFGVMGGQMQAQGHVQMVIRTVDYGQNLQAAFDAPRWRALPNGTVTLEHGVPSDVEDRLSQRGHRIQRVPDRQSGGAQGIFKLRNGYLAASDKCKDGQAVGF